MQHKIDKGTSEWDLFQEFWKIHQDYYNPTNISEWEQALKATDEFITKYKDTEFNKFARDLAMAHMNECERKYSNLKGERKE